MTVRTRPGRLLAHLLALALGLGTAGLAACGGSRSKALIPAANAQQLQADLDQVESAIDSGRCEQVSGALDQAQADIDQLPRGVSVRLVGRLKEGIAALRTQAPKACQANTTTTETVTTTAPTVAPTTTSAPTTTTEPPHTTTTAPPATTGPSTTTLPPDTGGVTTP